MGKKFDIFLYNYHSSLERFEKEQGKTYFSSNIERSVAFRVMTHCLISVKSEVDSYRLNDEAAIEQVIAVAYALAKWIDNSYEKCYSNNASRSRAFRLFRELAQGYNREDKTSLVYQKLNYAIVRIELAFYTSPRKFEGLKFIPINEISSFHKLLEYLEKERSNRKKVLKEQAVESYKKEISANATQLKSCSSSAACSSIDSSLSFFSRLRATMKNNKQVFDNLAKACQASDDKTFFKIIKHYSMDFNEGDNGYIMMLLIHAVSRAKFEIANGYIKDKTEFYETNKKTGSQKLTGVSLSRYNNYESYYDCTSLDLPAIRFHHKYNGATTILKWLLLQPVFLKHEFFSEWKTNAEHICFMANEHSEQKTLEIAVLFFMRGIKPVYRGDSFLFTNQPEHQKLYQNWLLYEKRYFKTNNEIFPSTADANESFIARLTKYPQCSAKILVDFVEKGYMNFDLNETNTADFKMK